MEKQLEWEKLLSLALEVGSRRADFIIENKIIVELKALINLEDVHLAQAKNYVVAYDFPIRLLINFGVQRDCNSKKYSMRNIMLKFFNPENPDSGNDAAITKRKTTLNK